MAYDRTHGIQAPKGHLSSLTTQGQCPRTQTPTTFDQFLVSQMSCGTTGHTGQPRQENDVLKAGARSTTDRGGTLLAREWLAALEVTLSTVLLIVAALLGVSFLRLMRVERGFEAGSH